MSDEPTIKPALTAEQAQSVLRRNVQNLVKKVQDGKLLNATEQALVESLADGRNPAEAKAWAKNKVDLAEALGVTRMSVDNWLGESAPAAHSNGLWPVNEWREWMRKAGKKSTKGEKTDAAHSKSQLEAKRLLLMNEKLEHEIAVLKGEYTKNTEIEAQVAEMIVEIGKELNQLPPALAPQLMGIPTVHEMMTRLRDALDGVRLRLHTGLGAKATQTQAPQQESP